VLEIYTRVAFLVAVINCIRAINVVPVAGSSTDPCSKFYQGPSLSSELEVRALQKEAVRLGPSLLTSIHIHTYGQSWLIPWGATDMNGSCVYAADHEDMVIAFVFRLSKITHDVLINVALVLNVNIMNTWSTH